MSTDTIHDELAKASPQERLKLVLLQLQGTGRLQLDSVDGRHAVLDGVDFSAAACEASGVQPSPQPNGRGLHCHGAQLAGARMDGANWTGANLTAADMTGGRARLARFDDASLDQARFDDMDLAASSFQRASLNEATFRRALLEDSDFSGASLRFADLGGAMLESATLDGADLWGATLDEAGLEGATLAGAVFKEASLAGASLRSVNLRGADLERANLTGADLTDADLRGARLAGASFRDAVLRNTRLEETDLSTCDLAHIHLSNAWMERTLLRLPQLRGLVGEERSGDYAAARQAYLSVQHNFESLGDWDAASWAYRRRRQMQKLEERERARRQWRARHRLSAISAWANYASDQAAEYLCDYGESVPRVLTVLILVYAVFTLAFGVLGSVVRPVAGLDVPALVTRDPLDLALFSLLAMASVEADVGLRPLGASTHILMALESLLGIGLMGLLGFVLGNRIRR